MGEAPCELVPSRLYQKDITLEEEVHEWFISYCEHFDWDVYSEVTPESERNIRCDALIHKERFGWFGVEIKHCDHLGTLYGGKRNAIDQVRDRYRGKVYHGEEVNAWAILPYCTPYRDYYQVLYQKISEFSGELGEDEDIMDKLDEEIRLGYEKLCSAEQVLKYWLWDIGMGWVDIDNNYLSMSFGRGSERSIAIGEPDIDVEALRSQWLKDVQETDIELIREEIGEKV